MTELAQGRLDGLYFAKGTDYYLYQRFVSEFRKAFERRYGGNASLVQRWGADLRQVTDVTSLLGGGGLFSSASLIILHEIQDAGSGVKTKLADLLANLPPDTVVLVHYSITDFRKAKWLDAMHTVARVVSLASPEPAQLPALVGKMAHMRDLRLDEGAVFRLIELSGGELAIIDNELEKITLFREAASEDTVSRELIDEVTGVLENAQASQFIDALFKRDRKLALQTLVEIEHQGKEGLPYLVSLVYNCLTQLMALRETPEARKTIGQGATSYFFLSKLQSFGRNYSMDELQTATRRLAKLDLQFRLGSMDTLTVMSEWVVKVV